MDKRSSASLASGWRMVPGGVVCGATGLLLGAVFSHWQADYDVLWSSVSATSAAHRAAEEYFLELVAEPGTVRSINVGVLSIVAAAVIALVIKLTRNDTSALLFDGASLLLYGAALSVYGTTVRNSASARSCAKCSCDATRPVALLSSAHPSSLTPAQTSTPSRPSLRRLACGWRRSCAISRARMR